MTNKITHEMSVLQDLLNELALDSEMPYVHLVVLKALCSLKPYCSLPDTILFPSVILPLPPFLL